MKIPHLVVSVIWAFCGILFAANPAYAIHIPTHPPALISATHLDLNAPGFVSPIAPGGIIFSPFIDADFNLGGLYHWETEIWNLGIVPAPFRAFWFAPDGGFPVSLPVILAPGAGLYAHLHVADHFFFPPEVGPRVHFAFNFTPFALGFDASVKELLPPLIGTEPGLEEFSFLGCPSGCELLPASTFGLPEFRFAQVPEPGSIALLGLGLSALAFLRRQRRVAGC